MSTAIILVTGGIGVFAAGVVVGHVATRWGAARDREVIAVRKDTAIEAALDTAQELQRISGEHPTVVGDDLDPEPWVSTLSAPVGRYGQAGGQRL